MKILVLGANGQLGFDLLRLGQKMSPALEWIPFARKELDLAQTEKIIPVLSDIPFDVLVNASGYNLVDDAETGTKEAMILNAVAVQKMAEVCEAKGVPFFHISTDVVFDGEKKKPYVENDFICPINVYGASKALGESLARQCCRQTFILRSASLFGIHSSAKKGNFVETIVTAAKIKKPLSVIADVVMSPTGTAALARILLALIQKEAPPGIYHAVNSGLASWYDFAGEILKQTGLETELIPVSSGEYRQKAARPSFSALNNSKTAAIVGEIPHWKEALREYLHEKK